MHGSAPGRSPPLGRRRSAFAAPVADPPTEDWASLLRSGYGVVFGALIDGIPASFGERQLYTVLGREAEAPSPAHTRSAALMITQGLATSCEPDREKGVSSGRALDIALRKDSLSDESLLTALFKTPALSSRLETTVSDPDAAVFEVDATTSWTEPGRGYIGLECFDFAALGTSGPYTASFEGITRGVAGMPHYHQAARLSGYATITDVPQHWRGRFVVLYEHLVSPEGRYLGDTWCTVGTYCRERWAGFIDAEPQDVTAGKLLRCLPLVRALGQEIGSKLALDVAMESQSNPLLAFTAADKITVETESYRATGPLAPRVDRFATLDAWCASAASDIVTSIGSANIRLQITAPGHPAADILVVGYEPGAPTVRGLAVYATGWFVRGGVHNGAANADNTLVARVPVDYDGASVAWLVLRAQPGADIDVVHVPPSGIGAIAAPDGTTELVRWDEARTSDADGQDDLVALRIVERQVNGTPRVNPWRWGGSLTVLSGSRGSWSDVAREILTSSGTGARGDYDRLGFGFGCGIPEGRLDVDTFTAPPMSTQTVALAATERRSLADVLGGWLALWSRCLVQRRGADGVIKLAVIDTTVTDDPSAESIGADDVLLGGHGAPETIDAPNTITCESSGYEIETTQATYRDRGRVQAEGARTWKLVTPGVTRDTVIELAPGIVSRLYGQAAIALKAPPGSDVAELQPGTRVALETAHPLVYDWTAGSYAPATINAIVLPVSDDLWTGVAEIKLLLQGRSQANADLCPAAPVVRVVSSTVIEVGAGEEDTFAVGDEVRVYEPGNEDVVSVVATITGIDADTHYVTLDTAVTSAPVLWMSYAPYGSVTADQTERLFVRSDKRWG